MKRLIVTALYAEAKPLIGLFKLKKDTLSARVPVYRSQTAALAISGTGKIRSAIATTYLLAQEIKPQESVIFNIGICGCADQKAKIGEMFFVHKITNGSSGRNYYPDVLIRHELPEAALITFDKPITEMGLVKASDALVDMEAAGFFESALTFLSPHQIVCLKIVSDLLQGERLERSQVSQLIEQNLEAIERVISNYDALDQFSASALEDYPLLEQLRAHLRLTATQYHQLIDWAKSYRLRKRGPLAALRQFLNCSVSTKQERNRYFERLRSILLDE